VGWKPYLASQWASVSPAMLAPEIRIRLFTWVSLAIQ
jgi:hypothetical protein